MTYCELPDLLAIIPEKELKNLTNDSPATADKINEYTVGVCMNFADELINAYVRSKYSLPFSYVPVLIKQLAADITAYRVYSRRPKDVPEHIKDNYDKALAILAKIQSGEIILDLASEHEDESGVQDPSGLYRVNKRYRDKIFNERMWRMFS